MNLPRYELHTVIPVGDEPHRLLEGSFVFAERVAEAFGRNPQDFSNVLVHYVHSLLAAGQPHDRGTLRWQLGAVR